MVLKKNIICSTINDNNMMAATGLSATRCSYSERKFHASAVQ